MKFIFSTDYTWEELQFIEYHHCEILSETNLIKTDFSADEIPRRMFIYCGTCIGEIIDDETGEFCWAVLSNSKSKGKKCYHWTACYDSLKALEQGL